MNNSPLVSIVMPAYNAADFIAESISSVQNQTYANWELLVIDDGSTDNTTNVVDHFHQEDPRIRNIPLPVNQGAGFARNIGIKASEGDFISFLDADDLWKPHKLTTQLDFMLRNKLLVSYSSYELIDEEGKRKGQMVRALKSLSFSKLLRANYIGNLTGMYNAAKLGKVYCPPIRKRQDWAMWINAVKKAGPAKGIPQVLALYRVRGGSISGNKWEMIGYNFTVFRKVLGYSFLKSSLCFIRFLFEQFFIKRGRTIQLEKRFELL